MTILSMVVVLLPFACRPAVSPAADATPPPRESARPAPTVVLPDGSLVIVEIAADDELRAQGLMYRERLEHGRGMLFFFGAPDIHAFWMKNTMIALDILWIDEQRRVVHIERNVPPCTGDPCPSYAPKARSSYVLELPSGEAKRSHVDVGAALEFRFMEGVRVQ